MCACCALHVAHGHGGLCRARSRSVLVNLEAGQRRAGASPRWGLAMLRFSTSRAAALRSSVLVLVAATGSLADACHAGFLGSLVEIVWEKPTRGAVWQGQDVVAQVGAGIEYQYRTSAPGGFAGFDFDIDDASMRLTFQFSGPAFIYFTSQDFNGLVIRDVQHALPAFDALTLGLNSGGISNQQGIVLHVDDADTLSLNLSNLRGASSGDWIEFNVAFVPAPSCIGMLALAGGRTRRRTSNPQHPLRGLSSCAPA